MKRIEVLTSMKSIGILLSIIVNILLATYLYITIDIKNDAMALLDTWNTERACYKYIVSENNLELEFENLVLEFEQKK